jgi:hypothetical protein
MDAVIEHLRKTFETLPDDRAVDPVRYPMADTLMSGFGMMFFQHPSLLNFQRAQEKEHQRCNLQTIFKVRAVPSDTQMRVILDGAPTEPLRATLPAWFAKMQRAGWVGQFRTGVPRKVAGKVPYTKTEEYYTAALDGSEYFHSTAIQCPGCLRKATTNGVVHYSHTVVSATLVKAGTHRILPLDGEEVRNTDGPEKQDCEVNAGKRLLRRLRQEHRQLKLIVTGDDLYAHEPFVDELTAWHMRYVLVAKPESHKELFEWVEGFERQGLSEHGEWTEGPAGRRDTYKYRIVRQVPLSGARRHWVTFVEVWVYDRKQELCFHNSWVTDLAVDGDNVQVIIGIGRSRWKIENEQFNVHKNHGYELEHNYGHGQKTLSMVFYLLNLLAFVAHIILEMGDRVYQQCRAEQSRKELWNILRSAMHLVLVDSWQSLLLAYLNPGAARAP